jgi:hypothetical protein
MGRLPQDADLQHTIRMNAAGSTLEKARTDGFQLLLFGCAIFLVVGTAWAALTSHPTVDFRPAYWSARTVLHHGDPYNPEDVLRVYHSGRGDTIGDPAGDLFAISHSQYPPSELTFTVFFALFPFYVAQSLWIIAVAAGVILAAFLMWKEGSSHAPLATGCLLFLFLINSPSLMAFGNPGCIAVCLCVIAVWCFLGERFIPASILCFAASLSIKPHDVGFVWLYFLLAGGKLRKHALIALAVTVAINLPAVLWITHISPHWMNEMFANVQAFSRPGGLNDPGPGTSGGRGIQMITDLQAIFSLYRNNSAFYNLASYVVCAPFLAAWAIAATRKRVTQTRAWCNVAAIAALSMLPIYHRQYDAKLILLAIPACAILLAERGRVRQLALVVTTIAIVLNGDFTWLILLHLLVKIPFGAIVPYLIVAPVPLSLLALGSFYLWAEMRHVPEPAPNAHIALKS